MHEERSAVTCCFAGFYPICWCSFDPPSQQQSNTIGNIVDGDVLKMGDPETGFATLQAEPESGRTFHRLR